MNNEINPAQRLQSIRERLNAARSGPWTAVTEGRDQQGGSSFIQIGEGAQRGEDLYLMGDDQAVPDADYDFIAHARSDIEFLLNALENHQASL